jgi:hypothetical protein
MADRSSDDQQNANLQTEYQEVGNNFRTLTDIRFKLLAFLPVGTAAGIALTVSEKQTSNGSLIGLFGLVVTASIALYNMRNDQLYDALVARAAQLERRMGLRDGAFAQRPRAWQRAGPFQVAHGQIWWIYLGSMIAWLFTLLHALNPMHALLPGSPGLVDLAEAIVVFGVVATGWLWIERQRKRTSETLRAAADEAMEKQKNMHMPTSSLTYEEWNEVLSNNLRWRNLLPAISTLSGSRWKDRLVKSICFYLTDTTASFYWNKPNDGEPFAAHSAAQLVGLVTDMPSRRIFDVASGRR